MKSNIKALKKYIILLVIINIVLTLATAAYPYYRSLLFDNINDHEYNYLILIGVLYFATICLQLLFCYFENLVSWKSGIKFEFSMKKDFFFNVISQNTKKFRERKVSEYISLQGNDITALEMDYLTPLICMFNAFFSIFVYFIVLAWVVDIRLAVVLTIVSLIGAFTPKLTEDSLAEKRSVYSKQMSNYVGHITDLLEGYPLINHKTKDNIIKEHDKSLQETSDKRFSYGKWKSIVLVINGSFFYIINLVSFMVTGYLYVKKEISIGEAIAALGYIECFIEPFNQIVYCKNAMSSVKGIYRKIEKFYADLEVNHEMKEPIHFEEIELKNVSLHYDNFALSDVNLKFQKNKKYVIVGESGSGKSTILNLIAGNAEASGGEILLDGESINQVNLKECVYLVNQEDHIYSTDFMNNVSVYDSYSAKGAFFQQFEGIEAYKSAAASEDCTQLSGGEKKLVSFIRSAVADYPIILLDEPFSATDKKLTETLQNVLLSYKDKTVILVTHKINEGLEQFDEIIRMRNGRVVNC